MTGPSAAMHGLLEIVPKVTWLEKVLDRRVGLTKRNNALGD